MSQNQHVKDYLEYYSRFPLPPRYAVMLNGPWGIGKTFLLKSFMERTKSYGISVVYVSLYGLSSLEEIDDALFSAVYPLIDNKATKMAGKLVKSAGKFFRLETDLQVKDFLDKTKADIFIFDDLERCDIAINRVLGYINELVEHEDRKVIIVANESEIGEETEYARIREKLIGKTLEIRSEFQEALVAFVQSVRSENARKFLAAESDVIKDVYDQSGLHNLRILQQTMWDFERFYTVLEDKHKENKHAMTTLLRMLCAISIEVKAGRLKAEDLCNRRHSIIAALMRTQNKDGAPSPFLLSSRRYPGAEIDSGILSDDTLIAIFLRGIIDPVAIRGELNASSFFVVVADEPAWRTVWHGYERTDEEFDNALKEMEARYARREYEAVGEILHVFGLRLWLAKIGVIQQPAVNVIAGAKQYIDTLYAEKRLQGVAKNDLGSAIREGGFGGLGIHECETDEYREIFKYLHEKRQRTAIDQYPALAEEVLSDMKSDVDRFFQRITLVSGGSNELYSIPVLAEIKPQRFVECWLSQHPATQRTILTALKTRYEHGNLDRDLKNERPWAAEVRQKLEEASKTMLPLRKAQLQAFLRYTLDAVLESEIGPDAID